MNTEQIIFSIIFLFAGFLISWFFYAKKSYELHDEEKVAKEKKAKDSESRKKNQFWLHFLGSFIGWLFAWYFLVLRIHLLDPRYSIMEFRFEGLDLFILLIAFLGITGYLPFAVLLTNLFKK